MYNSNNLQMILFTFLITYMINLLLNYEYKSELFINNSEFNNNYISKYIYYYFNKMNTDINNINENYLYMDSYINKYKQYNNHTDTLYYLCNYCNVLYNIKNDISNISKNIICLKCYNEILDSKLEVIYGFQKDTFLKNFILWIKYNNKNKDIFLLFNDLNKFYDFSDMYNIIPRYN